MQIELVSERSYTVKANGREIKGMRVVDTWNGLEKLEDGRGRFLIIAEADGPHTSAVRDAFGSLFGDEGRRVVAVLGTPDLVMDLTTAANARVCCGDFDHCTAECVPREQHKALNAI